MRGKELEKTTTLADDENREGKKKRVQSSLILTPAAPLRRRESFLMPFIYIPRSHPA